MAEKKEIRLTKRAIEGLPEAKPGKRGRYFDDKTTGLCLEVTDKGVKTFKWYRKFRGRPIRISLGRFPDMTVESARKQAEAYSAEIGKGNDPRVARPGSDADPSLGRFLEIYLERHAKPFKKTWREDEAQFRRYLSPWATRPLSAITKADVETLHRTIGQTRPFAANRLLSLLQLLFKKARDWDYFQNANPARGIPKFREKSRDRFLQADEAQRFVDAILAESNPTLRDFFLACLLTGARAGNVRAMRWDEIDFEGATWTLPETKNGYSHTIALPPPAIAILKARKTAAESAWVFPGKGKKGHLVEYKSGWSRIKERSGLTDLRVHDIRRTLGSWMAQNGTDTLVIGKQLGHRTLSATQVYARLTMEPVRKASEDALDRLLRTSGHDPDKLLG